MIRFIAIVIFSLLLVPSAWGDEIMFNGLTEIGDGISRIGSEAAIVATTPVDTEGGGFIGTLLTAGAVGLTYVYDNDIRGKLNGIRGKTADKAADVGNIIGSPYLHIGLAAAVYGGGILAGSSKYKELGEILGESVLLADATSFVLKQSIGRARPFTGEDKGTFRPFRFKNDFDSLPSMHTASSFAMASVLSAASENYFLKFAYYAAAAFVGFSRMYKDQHWASDVVLAAAVGELCARVVMRYHSDHGGERRLAIVPNASSDGVSVAVVGSW